MLDPSIYYLILSFFKIYHRLRKSTALDEKSPTTLSPATGLRSDEKAEKRKEVFATFVPILSWLLHANVVHCLTIYVTKNPESVSKEARGKIICQRGRKCSAWFWCKIKGMPLFA